MRILLIAYSHGRDMGVKLNNVGRRNTILPIYVGRKLSVVDALYTSKIAQIRNFHPEVVIVHCGHNDVMAHPVYNTHPQHIKYFVPVLVSFCNKIREDHPGARIYLSSIYPRSIGYHFSEDSRQKYNKLAFRYGELLRSATNRNG
jgi:hypothetical protein